MLWILPTNGGLIMEIMSHNLAELQRLYDAYEEILREYRRVDNDRELTIARAKLTLARAAYTNACVRYVENHIVTPF